MAKTERKLTPVELANRWNIARGTLANWRSSGKGPKFEKIGGAIRYPETAVIAFERKGAA